MKLIPALLFTAMLSLPVIASPMYDDIQIELSSDDNTLTVINNGHKEVFPLVTFFPDVDADNGRKFKAFVYHRNDLDEAYSVRKYYDGSYYIMKFKSDKLIVSGYFEPKGD